ncbi:MAG: type II secretion system protein GspE, partial [Ruthenibacterium sp.]
MNFFNAKLGEILLHAGVLTQQQLDDALEAQKVTKNRLGAQLIESGVLSERQLCEALQSQLHLQYVDLQSTPIDASVAALVPESMALASAMLPFDAKGGRLQLAVA